MRIAFISQYFFPEQFFHNAVAAGLVKRGHEVHVVTCVPNYGQNGFFGGYSNSQKRFEVWSGITIDRAWTIARGKSKLSLALNYLVFPIAGSWTVFRKIKERPDVSFVSMPSPVFQALVGIFLKKLRGIPCVYWVQDIWPESAIYTLKLRNSIVVRALTWICGWLYRQADCILVQSAGFAPLIERFGVDRDRIRVVPNTARSIYGPMSPESAYEVANLVPQTGFRLFFAGNIGESQDFDTLMAAAHILKNHEDIKWVIIGSGRGLARAKQQVECYGLGSQVLFLGRYPEELMPSFFVHADAMLVSLKDTPIFALTVPSKLQSYFASAKPVIASLAGEGARIVRDAEAGIVVPPGYPKDLAAAILEMKSASEADRRAYGANALRYYQNNFANEIVFNKLESTLAGVASARL